MSRKFGKRNVIKVSPVDYNLGLIGESGIGKTTLAKEVCEELVGEDGYIILNIGKEDGIDAIPNAIYEDIPDWKTFNEFTKDVIANRTTDYKDLKIIVYDTFDELVKITEPEVIRLNNKEFPDKQTKTIKAAYGGFQGGEDKVIEILLEKMWALKKVGINMFVLGHTKKRTMTDVVTGLEYDMLTTNMTHKYFNAIKTKLHVLGVASVNRKIETNTVKQKVGKDKVVGRVTDESRIITFRDDNFNIDSKSRFSDIIPSIPLDVSDFIKAVEDAIKVAHEKQTGKKSSIETTKQEQAASKEEYNRAAVEEVENTKIDVEENKELVEIIKAKFTSATDDIKTKIKEVMSEFEMTSFKEIDETPTKAFRKIVDLLG